MPSRPTIALALSGGAARGLAHVGVLRALQENKIAVDYVAGTSAGSIVGGAFAAGMPIDEIEALGRGLRWRRPELPGLQDRAHVRVRHAEGLRPHVREFQWRHGPGIRRPVREEEPDPPVLHVG